MSEWISVKDRLPDTGEPCLIVWSGCVQTVAYARLGMGFACCDGYLWETSLDGGDGIPDEQVTHWMPMPAPPKEAA